MASVLDPVATRFILTPGIAVVSALLELAMDSPLTVKEASCPACVWVIFCVPAGSWASRDCKVASPLTEIFILLLAPVCELVKDKRHGLVPPSFTIVAWTPILAALIEEAIP